MSRHKSSLLGVVIIGALLLAQTGAVLLVVQAGLGSAGGWTIALMVFALLLWSGLIAVGAVVCAQHLLLGGVEDACGRLEVARSSAHVGVLAAAPTLDLLGRLLRRQNSLLAEMRDNLVANPGAGHAPAGAVLQAHRLARAAGTAAGLLRTNSEVLRLVDTLDDWLTTTRTRHEAVRECAAELRETLEHLPTPAIGRPGPAAADPVFGFAVAAGAPAAGGDAFAHLPAALRERMRGSLASEDPEDDALGRN